MVLPDSFATGKRPEFALAASIAIQADNRVAVAKQPAVARMAGNIPITAVDKTYNAASPAIRYFQQH